MHDVCVQISVQIHLFGEVLNIRNVRRNRQFLLKINISLLCVHHKSMVGSQNVP